jgi:NAD+ synthetase
MCLDERYISAFGHVVNVAKRPSWGAKLTSETAHLEVRFCAFATHKRTYRISPQSRHRCQNERTTAFKPCWPPAEQQRSLRSCHLGDLCAGGCRHRHRSLILWDFLRGERDVAYRQRLGTATVALRWLEGRAGEHIQLCTRSELNPQFDRRNAPKRHEFRQVKGGRTLAKSDRRLRNQILDLSRQTRIGELSPFLSGTLDQAIAEGHFPGAAQLEMLNEQIIRTTSIYREKTGRSAVVLGMSGGVDSALTAAIFKRAGYQVVGVTMPIHQDPVETQRGEEACVALGLEHLHLDLSQLYDQALAAEALLDAALLEDGQDKGVRIRRGNVRARLRMITLYNLAAKLQGMVASTDNFSELGAGFWTLHGDVGDFSPIQALLKSWEVPYLAQLNGVPESTVRATPTDGLGIDAGDEAQLGCSYLEWDLMVFALHRKFDIPAEDERVRSAVLGRMGATWYKRRNPIRVSHPLEERYEILDAIDTRYFVPESFR